MQHDYEKPHRIMCCSLFLQLFGANRVRPEQRPRLDFDHLQLRKTPTPYPTQETSHAIGFRTDPALHGVAELQPYSEKEILQNSNYEKRK